MIVVAVTSNSDFRGYSVPLQQEHLKNGFLPRDSFVKVDKIYTLAQQIAVKKYGEVTHEYATTLKFAIDKLLEVDDL